MSVITNPSILTVGPVIGTTLKNIGDLCKFSGIKKWSARKPVRSSQRVSLADMSIADISYGFNQGEAEDNIYARTPDAILNMAIDKGGDWVYLRPRGVNNSYNEPYRLNDFEGYDHSAGPQFTPDSLPTLTGVSEITSSMNVDTGASIKLWNFKIVSQPTQVVGTWYYGVVYRSVNAQTGATLVLSQDSQGNPFVVGGNLQGGKVYCPITFPAVGEYHCAFVATQATNPSSTEGKGFIYLHNGYWNCIYSQQQTGIFFRPYFIPPIPSTKPIIIHLDSNNNVERIDFAWHTINQDATTHQAVQVHFQYYEYGQTPFPAELSAQFNLAPSEERRGDGSDMPKIEYTLSSRVTLQQAYIVVWVTYDAAAVRYFDFTNDSMVTTQPNPISLQTLLDSPYEWAQTE